MIALQISPKIESLHGLQRQATNLKGLYGILQLLQGSCLDNFLLKTLKLAFHSVTFQLKCLAFQSNQSSQSSHVLAMGY